MFSQDVYRNYKTLFVEKVSNDADYSGVLSKFLKITTLSLLALALISSVVTYLFVLSKENSLQALHSETSITYMDNVDIRNDVEFTRSIYNVYDKARTISYLHKPEKFLEIPYKTTDIVVDVDENQGLMQNRIVVGY